MSAKIIVTNQSRLKSKYGSKITAIQTALKALIQADKARGIDTVIVEIDNAAAMKKLGGTAVLDSASCKQNKAAIDKVFAAKKPDYLVILGAPDVVPHQDLKNPLHSAEDPDENAWGDVPYACEAAYSRDPKDFRGPTRVLGRIPDITNGRDPAYLVSLLQRAAKWQTRPATAYAGFLGVSAKVWEASTRLSLKSIFGSDKGVQLSPPKGPKWTAAQLGTRAHFINCHGALSAPHYFGQTGDKYPIAHSASVINGKIAEGTVAAVECCYGGELYDPAEDAGQQMGIANTYLGNGAYGFLGSTTIAYGPAEGNANADLICGYFLQEVRRGASLGRAALLARQRFVKATPELDPADLKTLAQFCLLGDPSVQPVEAPPAPHSAGMLRSVRGAAAKTPPLDFVRASRRREMMLEGLHLAGIKAAATIERLGKIRPSVSTLMKALAEKEGLGAGPILSFAVERPVLATRGGMKALTDHFEYPDAMHVAMSRRQSKEAHGFEITLLVAREKAGEILSVKKVQSR